MIYQDILKPTFFSFLTAQGSSHKTQKNYWSDVIDFISWFIAATQGQLNPEKRDPRLLFQSLLPDHMKDYLTHLQKQNISVATVNRRLSSLRIFFNCCLEMTWLDYHPMEGIANIKTSTSGSLKSNTSALRQFEDYLRSQNVGKATIKNYLSDVRGFLHWVETQGLLSGPSAHGSP